MCLHLVKKIKYRSSVYSCILYSKSECAELYCYLGFSWMGRRRISCTHWSIFLQSMLWNTTTNMDVQNIDQRVEEIRRLSIHEKSRKQYNSANIQFIIYLMSENPPLITTALQEKVVGKSTDEIKKYFWTVWGGCAFAQWNAKTQKKTRNSALVDYQRHLSKKTRLTFNKHTFTF